MASHVSTDATTRNGGWALSQLPLGSRKTSCRVSSHQCVEDRRRLAAQGASARVLVARRRVLNLAEKPTGEIGIAVLEDGRTMAYGGAHCRAHRWFPQYPDRPSRSAADFRSRSSRPVIAEHWSSSTMFAAI
jgi:hypothetical protein